MRLPLEAPRPRRLIPRGLAYLLVAAFTVSAALTSFELSPAPPVQATQQAPLTGLLLTVAATGDDLELMPEGGLVVQMTLTNAIGHDVSGLSLRAPIPARARVAASWFGASPAAGNPGTLQGSNIIWTGIGIENGERLGAFTFRLVPEDAANGATIFRPSVVQPEVTWTSPTMGRAQPASLRLNGLWGEGSLRRTVLPSGLTVFTRDRPDSTTVSLRIAVRAGSRDENDVTLGGSHWLEHAHFLGTVRRPDTEIDNDIALVGGVDNAATSWEYTDFWKLVPAEHFDIALDVLSDQLVNSTFRPERFERERMVVFEELKLRNDTPTTRAFDEFINLVFQVSPLRRHPAGTIESVTAIPISTILAHHAERYVTGNMAVAASGNLRHDAAVSQIEAAFAGLRRGPTAVRPAVPEPSRTTIARIEVGEGDRLAQISLGWPVPGDDHPDSVALFIADDLLDATGRRLSEEIRDRRALASSVGSSYYGFSDAGAVMLSATTRLELVDEVVDLMLAQIQRLRDGDVTDAEVRASLRANAGRQALNDESNQDQTGRASTEVAGVLDSFAEYQARLQVVTAADVQRVARTYLGLDNYVLVIVRS